MRRRTRRLALTTALAGATAGAALAGGSLGWEDLTEADWLFSVATRFADVDGHRVHYPTPTAELARLLAERTETAAKRQLADARLALGDRTGAISAIEAWAEAEGAAAWAEAARWGAAQGEPALAFRAAARALPGLDEQEQRALAGERVAWADAHPEAADRIAMRAERARLLPDDAAAAEDWIRALEKAGRLDEALAAVSSATALPADRRLLLRSDLAADHAQTARAFEILDASIEAAFGWPLELKRAYAQRADQARPAAPEAWRATLERAFDATALVRLATYFEGQERGDRAADLLRQVERRYETRLDRNGWLLLARLHGEIDAVPEAFRARLAAATKATGPEQADDLAALATLALRAGARPLGWGAYDEEPYRWAARVDRTPGFWTGGVAFLLTGTDWKDAISRLESESLADRTFATARALVAELERRASAHASLFGLRAAIMSRHVERGEGRQALALLPLVEKGPEPFAAEARRAALLAMRQVEVPIEQELGLWRARLRALAPDGSRPQLSAAARDWSQQPAEGGAAWTRSLPAAEHEGYREILNEAVSRMDQRDGTHRTAADLLLGEMDRLPDAEALWLELASRLESWNLDDELGPRYERALERFSQPGWWDRAARWYARRARHHELDRLASELTARFRGAAVFERAPIDDDVRLQVPDQPPVGGRVRLVTWGDWVRLKALERFPHSPTVFREARSHLLRRSMLGVVGPSRPGHDPAVVDDALLDERGWAVLFADEERREAYFADAMRRGVLAARLSQWEAQPSRTPVEELLLFEGRARLSQFEDAAGAAERLSALYPGEGTLAGRVLSLERSLAGLDPAHAAAAAVLVARTAPALVDPAPLWTELGELDHEAGRPDRAKEAWRHVLDRSPRDPAKVEELATLLWDYDETDDALATIEDARRRLGRTTLLAFEAGVLREEKHDVEGAVREYLDAGLSEEGECFCSAFERDQRALRRLSQLVGRPRVRALLEARITALRPGAKADEETLVAFYPLTSIRMPDADLDWTVDDWIDAMDHPVDPLARRQRSEDRERWRAASREGQARIAALLLARTRAMVDQATRTSFLDAVDRWTRPLLAAQPTPETEVTLTGAVMARRAELAATAEDRVTREIARARYLFEHERRAETDEAWKALVPRVSTLPQGAPRMRAEADRAAYLERSQGPAAASAEWERLSAQYPWSLGILEDRLAFLARNGRGADARAVLESTIPRAAAGHREALLERLAREATSASDLPQAERAVQGLLADATIDDGRRLGAVHLLARLALRRDHAADLLALVRQQDPLLKRPESRAELRAQAARAAALESAWKPAVDLWIEALNRRLDRGFIREACRAAARAGEGPTLVSFFQKQRARSPRDVRWAVALRQMRLFFGDIPGALEAAQAAIAVRPDRGSLWNEAADLLAAQGRPREGAELLAGWAKTRPGDEQVAARRSSLLAEAGDGEGALTVERAALAAFGAGRPLDEKAREELAQRRGRAARRLLELGLPRQAWALLQPTAGGRLLPTDLGAFGEAELAHAADHGLSELRRRFGDEPYRSAAAGFLSDHGRPEQKEEVMRWICGEMLPAAPAGRPATRARRPDFEPLWRFAQQAGLEQAVRVELARRLIARTPGAWTSGAGESFVSDVGAAIVGEPPRLLAPPLERLWAAELVRRARGDELWSFLAPRWEALVAQVRSPQPVGPQTPRVDWAAWLDDHQALALWAQAAAHDPSRMDTVAPLFTDRRSWDRLWALAARGWNVSAVIASLPEDARRLWFRLWLDPSPTDPNPSRRARGETVERASIALGRLVSGRDGAAADAVVVALRGPRTVGTAIDAGRRWDADLWGERPAPAWLVLEGLARLREKDPDAALVPGETSDRGGEGRRARLAARMAQGNGDAALASALADEIPSPGPADLARRLRLLQQTGRGEQAAAAFEAEVRREQPRLDEAGFRQLARIAEDLALADPSSLLDPKVRVPGPFLAMLCDLRGLAACRPLAPVDPADFRAALAARWGQRARRLSAEETRFALAELWAREAGPLPVAGLRSLGGLWPRAADWLKAVRPGGRAEAIAALEAVPDDAPLRALLAREGGPPNEAARLLLLRVELLRGEDEKARAAFVGRLAEQASSDLVLSPVEPAPAESEAEGEEIEEAQPSETRTAADPFVAGVRAWLAPFRDAGKRALVEEPARQAVLRRLESEPRSAPAWSLALDLSTTPSSRAATLEELERAWRMGDLDPATLAPVVQVLGRSSPAEADRWLGRLAARYGFEDAARRARLVAGLGRRAEAARILADARSRAVWTGVQEVEAFDLWRSLAPEAAATKSARPPGPRVRTAPAAAPAAWTAARPFWTAPAAGIDAVLASHLRAHPLDLLAARAALRSAAPADADAMTLAERALQQPPLEQLGDSGSDARLLHLRAARGLLSVSAAAARTALGESEHGLARELERRRIPAAEVRAALAEVARLLAATGDAAGASSALAAVEDRSREEGRSLRAALQRLTAPAGPPPPYRLVNGRPEPWRPRDLDWAVVEAVLDAEDVR